ncbi:MAG: 4a-hydroxytetrahydrobiopterin dehydratase [Actinomycetota bacterium]|jgi:4a-hydroxytetrahydrobiopterin dehydratase|nr:4a-hydroxytetrahydrobiopterin dehydratase [Actinomycetota bacterium]
MVANLRAEDFDGSKGFDDWRVLLGRIEASFVATSFDGAAAFVQSIAAAAEAADHHPDVDLRYPGLVHVVLTTHARPGGLTDADASLAATISALAKDAGLGSEPLTSTAVEVAIDAIDIDAVRPFWKAILGYRDDPPWAGEGDGGGQVVAIADPRGIGPPFWFQQMDEPRPQRNRFHIDVTLPHDQADARIAAALAAGGTLLTDRYARAFWVLADPEGNEACVCTWQDRG